MYRLYGRVRSRALRTLWMLEELGVPFEYVSAAPRSDESRAVHPSGKVPVLETPEGILLDSVAQMTFLADRHAALTHPAGSFARGRQDAFVGSVLEMLDAPLWDNALHVFALPEEWRVEAARPTFRWQVENYSQTVAEMMDGAFAVGETMTIADILLAHCGAWARRQKFELAPPILDHMRRMRDRPAFGRALAYGKDEE